MIQVEPREALSMLLGFLAVVLLLVYTIGKLAEYPPTRRRAACLGGALTGAMVLAGIGVAAVGGGWMFGGQARAVAIYCLLAGGLLFVVATFATLGAGILLWTGRKPDRM